MIRCAAEEIQGVRVRVFFSGKKDRPARSEGYEGSEEMGSADAARHT